MALPHVIEYLLSRPRGEGYLVSHSMGQQTVPLVPAGVQFTINSMPDGGDYAALIYESILHPAMVPDAFYATAQYASTQVVAGVLTATLLGQIFNSYQIIMRKQPGILTIRNRTNVPQFYSGIVYFVIIKTEGDYKEVINELNHLGNLESDKLLTAMQKSLAGGR